MEEWKQRLQDEHTQLSERYSKLNKFTSSPGFLELDEIDRSLLLSQAGYMKMYLQVLTTRLCRALGI